MMQVSSFTRPQESKNYSTFRSTFLETFGEDADYSLAKGFNIAVDQMNDILEQRTYLKIK